jgi:hypothetical protein
MAKSESRLQALEMRRKGKSIGLIAKHLGVSKSSASLWCRDIILTKEQIDSLTRSQVEAGNYGRLKGAEMNKRKRLRNVEMQQLIATRTVGRLTSRDMLMLGVALYWGEGSKSEGSAVAITNSDPETILFARNWFERLGVSRNMFRPYVFISDTHKSREGDILVYWSRLLDIPKDQFAKFIFFHRKPKKVYENHDSYYGVLALRVMKGKTLKYRILGLIRACKQKAGVAQW